MSLQTDAEQVADRAGRIATIIARAQMLQGKGSVALDDQPDLLIPFTAATRQLWQDKVQSLQAEIKSIVAGW